MPKDLIGEALPREDLAVRDVAKMYDVFQDHFDNTTLEIFRRDLDNKNWVILLRDTESGTIQGFSTLAC